MANQELTTEHLLALPCLSEGRKDIVGWQRAAVNQPRSNQSRKTLKQQSRRDYNTLVEGLASTKMLNTYATHGEELHVPLHTQEQYVARAQ